MAISISSMEIGSPRSPAPKRGCDSSSATMSRSPMARSSTSARLERKVARVAEPAVREVSAVIFSQGHREVPVARLDRSATWSGAMEHHPTLPSCSLPKQAWTDGPDRRRALSTASPARRLLQTTAMPEAHPLLGLPVSMPAVRNPEPLRVVVPAGLVVKRRRWPMVEAMEGTALEVLGG